MKRGIHVLFGVCALALLAIVTACGGGGGGGGGSSNNDNPRLFVSPASHDFGTVTTGNSAEPLSLTIRNDGRADLRVSSIRLSDTANYRLQDPNSCAGATLRAGNSCTARVVFEPASDGSHGGNLIIASNDPNRATFRLPLQGVRQAIESIELRINQIDACPRPSAPGDAIAYVSVRDQGGFPVNGLVAADFRLAELPGGWDAMPLSAAQVAGETSVAIIMDYSTSITNEPVDVERMEDAAIAFVQRLGADDFVEIIKFADITQIRVTPFTNSKQALIDAIDRPVPADWEGTALHSSIARALEDFEARPASERKAIIVVSDGYDTRSTLTQAAAIDAANDAGIPVFTIGLGDVAEVNRTGLAAIADETGGTYSDSETTANLATIFQQLADVLFLRQYRLSYTASDEAVADSLEVTVTHPVLAIEASHDKEYPLCP